MLSNQKRHADPAPEERIATDQLTIAAAQAILTEQPFSRLIGAQITQIGAGTAELTIPLRPDLLQQFDFVHGGVIAYAADNCLSFSAGTVLGPAIVTRGFTIEYLRPAQGIELVARAVVVNESRRQALCRAEVLTRAPDGATSLCAAAQGSISRIDLR